MLRPAMLNESLCPSRVHGSYCPTFAFDIPDVHFLVCSRIRTYQSRFTSLTETPVRTRMQGVVEADVSIIVICCLVDMSIF